MIFQHRPHQSCCIVFIFSVHILSPGKVSPYLGEVPDPAKIPQCHDDELGNLGQIVKGAGNWFVNDKNNTIKEKLQINQSWKSSTRQILRWCSFVSQQQQCLFISPSLAEARGSRAALLLVDELQDDRFSEDVFEYWTYLAQCKTETEPKKRKGKWVKFVCYFVEQQRQTANLSLWILELESVNCTLVLKTCTNLCLNMRFWFLPSILCFAPPPIHCRYCRHPHPGHSKWPKHKWRTLKCIKMSRTSLQTIIVNNIVNYPEIYIYLSITT